MLRPVPEFIAAVIPTTRRSRSHSRTSASPKTWVYCGLATPADAFAACPSAAGGTCARGLRRRGRGRGGRGAVEDRLRLRRMPLLHSLQAPVLRRREALALDRGDVHHHRAFRRQRLAQRLAQRAHVVAVDHAHVGPVELLPPQARGPECLQRLLQLGPSFSNAAPTAPGRRARPPSTPSRACHSFGLRRTRLK